MSRIANSARPASSSFGASVDADGSRISSSIPARSYSPRASAGVEPGVDRVGREVEHEGRLVRGARFSTAVAAAHERERERGGRQRRGDPSHCGRQVTRVRSPG